MVKLNSREDLIKFREQCAKALASETKKILICGGTGCVAGGALDIRDRLKTLMAEAGIECEVDLADEPQNDVV